MNKLLVFFLMLLLASSVYAQTQAPLLYNPTYHGIYNQWEWGASSQEIENRLLSEPGWKVIKNEVPDKESTEKAYESSNREVTLLYSYKQNVLYRRGYSYGAISQEAQRWNMKLMELPYDENQVCWIDNSNNAIIRRKYSGESFVLFVVEFVDFDHAKSADKTKK